MSTKREMMGGKDEHGEGMRTEQKIRDGGILTQGKGAITLRKKIVKVWMMMKWEFSFDNDSPSLLATCTTKRQGDYWKFRMVVLLALPWRLLLPFKILLHMLLSPGSSTYFGQHTSYPLQWVGCRKCRILVQSPEKNYFLHLLKKMLSLKGKNSGAMSWLSAAQQRK